MEFTPEKNYLRSLSLFHNEFASTCITTPVTGFSNADSRTLTNIIKFNKWAKVVNKDKLHGLLGFSIKQLNVEDQDLLREVISNTWAGINEYTARSLNLLGSIMVKGQALTKADNMMSKIAEDPVVNERGTAIAAKKGFEYFKCAEFERMRSDWHSRVDKLFAMKKTEEDETSGTTVSELARAAAEAARVAATPDRITVAVASMPAPASMQGSAPAAAAVGVPVADSAAAVVESEPVAPTPAPATSVDDMEIVDAEIAAERATYVDPTAGLGSDTDDVTPAPETQRVRMHIHDLDDENDEDLEVVLPAPAPASAPPPAPKRAAAERDIASIDAANVENLFMDANTGSYFEKEFDRCAKWARLNNSESRFLEFANKDGFKFLAIRRIASASSRPDPYVEFVKGSRADRFATRAGVHKKRLRSKRDIRLWWDSIIASEIDLSSF